MILLEPVAPGTEGVVDLYLMPGYDDIASLYHYSNRWKDLSLGPQDGRRLLRHLTKSPSWRKCETMPNEAFAWLTRIKSVEREYVTVRLALDRLDSIPAY